MGSSNSKTAKHSSASSATPLRFNPPHTPTTPTNPTYEGVPRSKATSYLPTHYEDDTIGTVSSTVTSPASGPSIQEDPGISPPAPAPHLRKLSELIDPNSIFDEEWTVKSPSGNMLGRHAFQEREDRPLSMRERQERIRQEIMRKNSYAVSGVTPSVDEKSSPNSRPQPSRSTSTRHDETRRDSKGFLCF